MISEYATESFQCGRRCVGHPVVCGDLPAATKRVDAAIESEMTWLLHRQSQADVAPSHRAGLMSTRALSNWINGLPLRVRFESDSKGVVRRGVGRA
jgi:hypothetical protein